MKKSLGLLSTVIFAVFMATGCATDPSMKKLDSLSDEGRTYMETEPSYQRMKASRGDPRLLKKVNVTFRHTPVYLAVKKVSKQVGMPFDTTFAPSKKYRITTRFSGTVGDFLIMVQKKTGVDYRYRDGYLRVFNTDYIEKEYRAHTCHEKGSSFFELSLRKVPPRKVFDYFINERKFSVRYDTKFFNLSGNKRNLRPANTVDFFYKGCDELEAIKKFAKSNDYDVKFTGKKSFMVRDYETQKFDVPSYFTLDFKSGSNSIGEGDGTGTKLSEKEDYNKELQEMISTYMSPLGKAFLSKRGYLVVTDVPSSIRTIKGLMLKETRAQQTMDLAITIIRVDVSDNFKNGVDWSAVMASVGKSLNIRNLALGLNYADMVSGGFTVSGIAHNQQQIVKFLSKYGNAKVAREYRVKTRSGILSTFKAVDKIPYITTSVTQDGATAQSQTEAKEVEAGIILNVKPTLSQNNELVNFSIDITVSEYTGDKTFKVQGGDFVLPQISTNRIQVPASVSMNRTIVLTGLKLKNGATDREGIPELSRLPHIGGMFGYNSEEGKTSEFLIMLTPTLDKRF